MVGAAAELAVPSPPPQVFSTFPSVRQPIFEHVSCTLAQVQSSTFPLGLDDNLVIPLVSCIVIQTTVDAIANGHVY
jgi:dolichol kinase